MKDWVVRDTGALRTPGSLAVPGRVKWIRRSGKNKHDRLKSLIKDAKAVKKLHGQTLSQWGEVTFYSISVETSGGGR